MDVALVRLAVSRGLLSPSDGQRMETLHQQGQGSALQLLGARGLELGDLQRSFGSATFGCTACGFSCPAGQLSTLPPDLRCPKCGQTALAPGRSASGRVGGNGGSSYVRPTGAYSAARTSGTVRPGSGRAGSAPGYPAPSSAGYGSSRGAGYGSSPSGGYPAPSGGYPAPSGGYPAPSSAGYGSSGGQVENSHMPRQGKIGPGSTIGGYHLGQELGRGACGVVFLGRRPGLSREFAIKILRQDMLGNEEAVARFYREADLASKLSDPGVVGCFDVGQDGVHCYYAMDYCPGETLKQRIRSQPYSVEKAVELAQELARIQGVAHAKGVMHRDFKPSNIILSEDTGRPRVTDFGLARDTSATGQSLSRTGDLIGTPIYMSPEQLLGERADVRADVYALGVILYEMLCGKRPFDAPTTVELASMVLDGNPPPPRSINPSLDPELEAIVLKALAKDRNDRYPNGAALESALIEYRKQSMAPAPTRRKRVSERLPTPGSGRPKLPLLAAAGGALLVLAIGALLFTSYQAEQERLARERELEKALVAAHTDVESRDWEAVPGHLQRAFELADALERPDAVREPLREAGHAFIEALDVGSTRDISGAESQLATLETWPGFDRAPMLEDELEAARRLLGLRSSLAGLAREASQNRAYADLDEDFVLLEAEVDPEFKPYVELARIEMALRRCQLFAAEERASKLLRALRLPPEVERAARLCHVISLVWLQRHDQVEVHADALIARWPAQPEGKLAECLLRFSSGDVQSAQERVRLVVDEHPDWLPAKIYGAVLVYYSDSGGSATEWLSVVEEAQPDNTFMHFASALAGLQERNMAGVEEHFNLAVKEANPPLLELMLAAASVNMWTSADPQQIEAQLRDAERVYPTSAQPGFLRGTLTIMQSLRGLRTEMRVNEELVEAGAAMLRQCKEDSARDYALSMARVPERFRDPIEDIVQAPEGEASKEVMKIVRSMMFGGGGGNGGNRRRRR